MSSISSTSSIAPPRACLRARVLGAVQGVGFRPFVYRLARDLALGGWVRNAGWGVEIEVTGPDGALEEFLLRLQRDRPPLRRQRPSRRR